MKEVSATGHFFSVLDDKPIWCLNRVFFQDKQSNLPKEEAIMDNVSKASACDSLLERSDLYVIMSDRGRLLGAENQLDNPGKTILVFLSGKSDESYLASHVGREDALVAGHYEGLSNLKEGIGQRAKGCQFWLVDEHGEILEKTD
jgi:hypothetical protein